ncbi:hypothetical protein [Pseudoclavibacter sp. RFBA6]|uniref:hypothetical protein n=1 Tax=Pseudoclavibacter sp. RFBA6 TaxID=2080573 RepID=UPI0011B09309|nr:hypothetical protein [Pseudoclavibacter sp. RFBA6]
MPNFEYGNLYKFVASIAALLLVAAVVGPWLFYQSMGSFLVSSEEIAALTPTAAQALLDRQASISDFQRRIPYISALMAFSGVALLVWSLIEWRKGQNRLDDKAQTDLEFQRAQLRSLTPEEAETKRESEVDEDELNSSQDTSASATAESPLERHAPTPAPNAGSPSSATPTTTGSAPEFRREDRIKLLKSLEDSFNDAVSTAYSQKFDVERDVKVTSGAGSGAMFDIALEPREAQWGQLGLNLKIAMPQTLRMRLPQDMVNMAIATQGLQVGRAYTGLRGNPPQAAVSGVLVYLFEEEKVRRRYGPVADRVALINRVLTRPIGVLIMSTRAFEELSWLQLRDQITKLWVGRRECIEYEPAPRDRASLETVAGTTGQ